MNRLPPRGALRGVSTRLAAMRARLLGRRLILACVALAAAALVVAGCGENGTDEAPAGGEQPTPEAAAQKGIPKALAANRAEANEILEENSLESKLEALRGHPVVVNQWASWCDPCRAEFPFFRDAAEAHADEVGFLGIDMQDDRGAAEDFLAELPVPYPSVFDPDATQIASLGGGVVSPTTVFIDEEGEIVEVFQGAYATREQLEADIERNLLN